MVNGLGLSLNLLLVAGLWSYESGAGDRDRDYLGPWFVLISLAQVGNLILAVRSTSPARAGWLQAYVWPANLMVAFTAALWYRNAADPSGLHAPWFWSFYSAVIAATGFLILRVTRARPHSS